MRRIRLDPLGASGVDAARQHVRVGERRLFPGHLGEITTLGKPVKLLIKGSHLTLNCLIGRIHMIEVKLTHYMPLVGCPLRRRMRRNFRGIILERKSLDFIGAKSALVQPDILIARVLGGVLFRIAPTKLHRGLSTDGCPAEVVTDDASCDRSPVDEDLYS